MMIISKTNHNGLDILSGESDQIKFEMAPALGGKILSIYNKQLQKEFLWKNKNLPLQTSQPGADYDSNFWGGIDELIPNDIPETIDGLSCPDHGELWTTPLTSVVEEDKITVSGKLKLTGLVYKKTVYLEPDSPVISLAYSIRNDSPADRHFLWKLHAALAIAPGDRLITSAHRASVVDPDYSRFKELNEFAWPMIENTDASLIPGNNNTMDFFYLYPVDYGEMSLVNGKENHLFSYRYDKKIFPFQWYFASYGKFLNHYTAILEPCTSMPMSVNEAKTSGQCSLLAPGQEINTIVRIYAGKNN